MNVDISGFAHELNELRKKTFQRINYDDFVHLRKFELCGKCFTFIGYATAWIVVNPISIFCISMGILTRWLLMHHIGHGGYDKVPGIPERYTSKKFALGKRRYLDWFEWMYPEAWNYEHNYLHHYFTSEHVDPDLVERNVAIVRDMRAPIWVKYICVFLSSISWKFTYYAANTLNALESKRRGKSKESHENYIHSGNFWDVRLPLIRELWIKCLTPYVCFHFVCIPLAFLPLGNAAVLTVLVNRILAEFLNNFHTFVIILPNHAGHDLPVLDTHYSSKEEFYFVQTVTSVNYKCGTDTIDYLHMWLNYQIEHHLFPNLPIKKYQEIQPEVKRICHKYGVPYIQESVFVRLRKMVDIAVGNASMKVTSPRELYTSNT